MQVVPQSADAVHEVSLSPAFLGDMARLFTAATQVADRAGRAAELTRRQDPQAARAMLQQAKNLRRVARDFERQLQVAVPRAAQLSQSAAVSRLNRQRARTGRADQPESFISASGARVGTRVRLRRSIANGVTFATVGGLTIPVTIKVGVLADLEKARDSQGRPVWPFVEYPWRRAPRSVRGFFYTAGKTSAPGAGRGDAVFVPSAVGGSLTVRKLHRGYGFLEAGRQRADVELARSLSSTAASINKQCMAISRAIERAARQSNARLASAQRKGKPGGKRRR